MGVFAGCLGHVVHWGNNNEAYVLFDGDHIFYLPLLTENLKRYGS